MSKTDDMSSLTELLCRAGAVMELPMLAFHQASAILTGSSMWTRFEVARSEEYCGQSVEDELNRVGVSSTGRGFIPGSKEFPYGLLTFCVKKSQRRWAEYALRRCTGFNVVTVVDAKNAEWAAQHDGPIPAWSGKASKMGVVTRQHAPIAKKKTAETRQRKGGLLQQLVDWLVE